MVDNIQNVGLINYNFDMLQGESANPFEDELVKVQEIMKAVTAIMQDLQNLIASGGSLETMMQGLTNLLSRSNEVLGELDQTHVDFAIQDAKLIVDKLLETMSKYKSTNSLSPFLAQELKRIVLKDIHIEDESNKLNDQMKELVKNLTDMKDLKNVEAILHSLVDTLSGIEKNILLGIDPLAIT